MTARFAQVLLIVNPLLEPAKACPECLPNLRESFLLADRAACQSSGSKPKRPKIPRDQSVFLRLILLYVTTSRSFSSALWFAPRPYLHPKKSVFYNSLIVITQIRRDLRFRR